MPEKIINTLSVAITELMTLVSYATGFFSMILMSSWVSLFGLVPTLLATLYWIPRIRRDIIKDHKGSFWLWVTSYFKKK